MRLVVLIGFLLRAFVSQILFWISYFSLPFAKTLQIGNGLWFFALDAQMYTNVAAKAAAGGLDDIALLPMSSPSVTYIQALAVFSFLFGNIVSVALLLNLFCYLGACAIIVRWSATNPEAKNAALIALIAISLSPGAMLWSLQPLKDTFFQFLIIAFFGACFLWQRAWREERFGVQAAWAAVALIVAHYLLSGVRWYVGLLMLFMAVFFLPLVGLTLNRRRWLASAAALLILLVLSRTYLFAAAPYLPASVSNVLQFRRPSAPISASLAERVQEARLGFERTGGGNTTIRPYGQRLAEEPATPVTDTAPTAVATATVAPVQPPPQEPAPAPAPEPVATKPAPKKKSKKAAKEITPAPAPAVTTAPAPAPAPAPVPAPAPAPVVVKKIEPPPPPPPPTFADKVVAGVAATALPRILATKLGLVEIGGGRGLWWFVDLDTLFFDLILIMTLISVVMNLRKGTLRNAVFWMVVAVTLLNAAALVYTVTNFGTLFRLRVMIFTSLALIPLALVTAPSAASMLAPKEKDV